MIIVAKRTELMYTYVDVIQPQNITADTQLYSQNGRAFYVMAEGDGDPTVVIMVTVGNEQYRFAGDQVALDIQGTGTLTINASGNGKTPTIRVLRFA